MQKHIDPTRGGTGGEKFPATAVKYVTQVLQVLKGASLGERDTRELKTLAAAMDCLATGRLCKLGDILMQRFKSIETLAGRWTARTHPHRVLGHIEPKGEAAGSEADGEETMCRYSGKLPQVEEAVGRGLQEQALRVLQGQAGYG